MYTEDHRGTGVGKGLEQPASRAEKEKDIKAAENAQQEFLDALAKMIEANGKLRQAEQSGDPVKIKAAKEELIRAEAAAKAAATKATTADGKAKEDPNSGGISRTTSEQSACEQALEAARELLRECHRTQWKDFRCQQLNAKMNYCPDPALILVDPGQGYSCGEQPDAEAVKNAWVIRCEERMKFAPDGTNPCNPPSVEGSGRYIKGKIGDVCNDPHAYITPDSEICAASFDLKPFGQPDIQKIVLLLTNKFGGPMIVIPKPKPGCAVCLVPTPPTR